jgi:glycosyltransferase involved in cell wall biosynthesis
MRTKTIIIPCFNEFQTIELILERVKKNIRTEDNIIIVDDGSNDGTKEYLESITDKNIDVKFHDVNQGKGQAIQTALSGNLNEIIIIQDADLEYNPNDYRLLLKPFEETNADVVYGSRFIGTNDYVRVHLFWHYLANKILTFICNIFTNLNMTDMETGYKSFKKDAIQSIKLNEKSFGIEPEITVKLAKKKFKFYEVPISYAGRSYNEGKKIGFKDAVRAVYCILKYSFKS